LRRIRLHRWRKDRQTVVVEERFPGELEVLRTDNVRLRRLPQLSEEQARAADPDQATLTGAPESPVSMRSAPEDKVRFFLDLFCCRSDVYALRWENRRDGRSGWMPAIRGYWRNGMNRADAPYLPLTPDVIGLYSLGDDDTCWWVAGPPQRTQAMAEDLPRLVPSLLPTRTTTRRQSAPAPMLATLSTPSTGDGWAVQNKFDGPARHTRRVWGISQQIQRGAGRSVRPASPTTITSAAQQNSPIIAPYVGVADAPHAGRG